MELTKLWIELQELKKRVVFLEQENLDLRKENAQLRSELSKYNVSKNSSNSSIPPSKDLYKPKKNQSLRKSDKPLGGQPGHKGNTLKMVTNPDAIIELKPDYCQGCGASLENTQADLLTSRQQIDLPPITPIYTEYRCYSATCNCGAVSTGDFPSWVNASVSYGPVIEGLVGYFHARQYLPFARMKEVFNDLFNVPITQGGIECLLHRFSTKTAAAYQLIKDRLFYAKVVGSDETSVNINGKNHWMWVWQTPELTYINCSSSRGFQAIREEFVNGFEQAVLVSDGWKPQLNTKAKHHQSCLAHLLRRLNYLKEKYPTSNWAKAFQELLYESIQIKQQHDFASPQFLNKRAKVIQQLDRLLEKPPDKKHNEVCSFFKRMKKESQYLFIFLYIPEVPFDNNASERAIRNIKVKQKISGQFKNQQTAQNFAMIRSVIDTVIKNGNNIWEALSIVAKNQCKFAY